MFSWQKKHSQSKIEFSPNFSFWWLWRSPPCESVCSALPLTPPPSSLLAYFPVSSETSPFDGGPSSLWNHISRPTVIVGWGKRGGGQREGKAQRHILDMFDMAEEANQRFLVWLTPDQFNRFSVLFIQKQSTCFLILPEMRHWMGLTRSRYL